MIVPNISINFLKEKSKMAIKLFFAKTIENSMKTNKNIM